jgi:hypothetical protein
MLGNGGCFLRSELASPGPLTIPFALLVTVRQPPANRNNEGSNRCVHIGEVCRGLEWVVWEPTPGSMQGDRKAAKRGKKVDLDTL